MYSVKTDFDCQMLYFTSSSLLADGTGIVFIGERGGNPNIYCKDFASGRVKQLTHNTEGTMKSYVYFYGREHRGLGKASVCLDQVRGIVYYLQGDDICKADLDGNVSVLGSIPHDQVTAFMHVSGDGTRLCVPTSDWRVLDDEPRGRPIGARPDYDIDERVQKERLNSYLRVYDTATGEQILCERVPRAWITHVQFHPTDNGVILYNHEWACDWGVRRIWLWNGKYHRALRTVDEGRNINDVVYHEVWSADGKHVIYHGTYAYGGRHYVGRITPETGKTVEIALPESFSGYGHFTTFGNDMLVSDGYYVAPGETAKDESKGNPSEWITVQKADWEAGTMEWYPVEKHGSSWLTQDAHPHPIYSADGKRVYYTTDCSGRLEIRSAAVPQEALL